jgi:hypothetical protein
MLQRFAGRVVGWFRSDPYSAAAQFVPRDFLWMYPALAMMLAFVVLAACVRQLATGRRLPGTLGLGFAVASMTVVGIDYFIQLRVVQPALLNGELDGLVIVSQYNPHGVFIALEEFGFLLAGLAWPSRWAPRGSSGRPAGCFSPRPRPWSDHSPVFRSLSDSASNTGTKWPPSRSSG